MEVGKREVRRIKRKQFTFYYSFYDVISCIEEPREQAEAYDALCRYALMGVKPDFENLPENDFEAVLNHIEVCY